MREPSKLENQRLRRGCCPKCGEKGLIAGPRGGLSRNWYCEKCRTAFCLGHSSVDFALDQVWLLQLVDWPDDVVLDLYR